MIGPPSWAQLETRDNFATATSPVAIAVGDFNRDGKMDIVTASVTEGPEVQVFLGNGDGTFRVPTAYDVGQGTGPLAVADLNHDGNLDIVVANGACPDGVCTDEVSVLLGNGDGTFQDPVSYAVPADVGSLVLGDFNGDGKLDIAMTNRAINSASACDCIGVLLGNGDGTFQEPAIITYPPAGYPEALAAGYFKAGGRMDLAVTLGFETTDKIQILLGNGDGTFTPGEIYDLAPESISIVAADFRNDHKTDLAVAEFEGMGVAVLLGNGDGTFEQPAVYNVGTASAVAAADLSNNGILDLVVASDYPAGSATVFKGKGDGTFQGPVAYSAGQFPWAIAIADFNRDRLPDVALLDTTGNANYILLNTGVATFSPTTPLNFKKQKHGTTSTPQTVKLTNTGKTALKISGMKATGQFGMTSTCGASVAAGKTCSISVTFSPTTQGAKSGAITIEDSASSKPQVIELSGTGM
jgi:hypothetical protein